MKKVCIFGTGQTADLAHYYLKRYSNFNIAAFTVQQAYLKNNMHHGLPVVPFEQLTLHYNPNEYNLFAPCPASALNKFRQDIYMQGKNMGYNYINYIDPNAKVETEDIGDNNFIFEFNNIQPYTKIGNNCILWSGNHIGHHSTIGDNVFVTSHVCVSGNCRIQDNAFLGVNSAVNDGVTVANHCVIGSGAIVTKSTEPQGIYVGNPAKRIKDANDKTI